MKRANTIVVLIGFMLVVGCGSILPKGKPSPPLKRYALEYTAPAFKGLPRLDAAIRVERFSIARIFDSRAMLYRPEPHRYAEYHSFVWIANPADMITDFLVRDLQSSGLFTAVFSHGSPEQPRFLLEGGVSEFFENDEREPRAVLSVNATLLDLASKSLGGKIVFQKSYSVSKQVKKTPGAFATGMSAAAAELNAEIILDAYKAIQNRCSEYRVDTDKP
jgi:ABC-type uncharacterized transport system auxiliary subunit